MQKFIMNIFNKDIISNSAVLESEAKRKSIKLYAYRLTLI